MPIIKNSQTHLFANRRKFIASMLTITGSILIPIKASSAAIREISGPVFVNQKRADISTPIQPGDNIVVSHKGNVTFTIGEDGFMVRSGTVLKLDTDDGLTVKAIRLLTGALLSVYGKGKDKEIITSTAVLGIRGTGLYLDVQPMKTYFCTCYGETTITADGHIHPISSTHHQAYNIIFDIDGAMTMKATKVIGHTDDELRQLETYFGRKPAFDI